MMAYGPAHRACAFRALRALTFACSIAILAVPAGASAADINIVPDEAKLVKLPEKVTTLVIGNPLIADASVQPGGLMVITGKGYGLTNIIALDRGGAVLMDKAIEVHEQRAHVVYVYKGVDRESYSCTPYCERRIMLGDTPAYFDAVINQTATRNAIALGAAPATSK
jgi:hypothetical protein